MQASNETIYLGLFISDGQLRTARVKQLTIVRDDDGIEIARREHDEAAIPDGDPIENILGEALTAALRTNQANAETLASEQQGRADDAAQYQAQIQALQAEIEALKAQAATVSPA